MKRVGLLAVILPFALMVSGCYKVVELPGSTYDPGMDPVMDSQLNPGFSNQSPTVCLDRASQVGGRRDHCRVERGYEDGSGGWPDDNRQWLIDYGNDPFTQGPDAWWSWGPYPNELPVRACPYDHRIDFIGCAIVVGADGQNEGWKFEGCVFRFDTNAYVCDYRSRFDKIMGDIQPFNFLGAFVDWAKYVKNAASCAISAFKIEVTNAMLVACDDAVFNQSDFDGAPNPEDVPLLSANQTNTRTRIVLMQQ